MCAESACKNFIMPWTVAERYAAKLELELEVIKRVCASLSSKSVYLQAERNDQKRIVIFVHTNESVLLRRLKNGDTVVGSFVLDDHQPHASLDEPQEGMIKSISSQLEGLLHESNVNGYVSEFEESKPKPKATRHCSSCDEYKEMSCFSKLSNKCLECRHSGRKSVVDIEEKSEEYASLAAEWNDMQETSLQSSVFEDFDEDEKQPSIAMTSAPSLEVSHDGRTVCVKGGVLSYQQPDVSTRRCSSCREYKGKSFFSSKLTTKCMQCKQNTTLQQSLKGLHDGQSVCVEEGVRSFQAVKSSDASFASSEELVKDDQIHDSKKPHIETLDGCSPNVIDYGHKPPSMDESAIITEIRTLAIELRYSDVDKSLRWYNGCEQLLLDELKTLKAKQAVDSNLPAPSSLLDFDEDVLVNELVESLGCFSADQVRVALKECDGEPDLAGDLLFRQMVSIECLTLPLVIDLT